MIELTKEELGHIIEVLEDLEYHLNDEDLDLLEHLTEIYHEN